MTPISDMEAYNLRSALFIRYADLKTLYCSLTNPLDACRHAAAKSICGQLKEILDVLTFEKEAAGQQTGGNKAADLYRELACLTTLGMLFIFSDLTGILNKLSLHLQNDLVTPWGKLLLFASC